MSYAKSEYGGVLPSEMCPLSQIARIAVPGGWIYEVQWEDYSSAFGSGGVNHVFVPEVEEDEGDA